MHARVCVCNVRSNIKLFIYDIHFVGRTKKYTNYFLVLTHFSLFVSFISAPPNMDDGVSATHNLYIRKTVAAAAAAAAATAVARW